MQRHGSLRASDADREGIIQRLHTAATEGRIAAEELEERVSAALKAQTYAELDRTVADLPKPRPRSVPARRGMPGWALATIRTHPLLLVLLIPALAVTVAMVLAATVVWMVLMVVLMVLGGRPRVVSRPPWVYYRRGYARHHRRRPGGFWA